MKLPDFSEARGRHVLAALSGGADSVALLFLLCRARESGILDVSAAHFEHGIRGAESRADAEFCKALCEKWQVPFYMGRADVPEIARRTREGCETAARRLRYGFLRELMPIIGADLLALAHHMDDQVETVLMHLLRGAGPEGVTGMKKLRDGLYRPLLDARKSEILEYLKENGVPWREDLTNAVADNPRNRLRIDILPALESVYPGAADALARYARYADIENEYMARAAERWKAENVKTLPHGWRLDMTDCEEALARRAIRSIVGRDLTGRKLDEIMECRTETDIVNGLSAKVCGGSLYILKPYAPPPPAYLSLSGATRLSGLCEIRCAPCENVPERASKTSQNLSRAALEGACLRTRCEGDWLIPLGMTGRKSLSDYLTDRKIEAPLRDILPVIARGSEILWVVGAGISERAKLDQGEAVRLECSFEGWEGMQI